MAATFSGSGPGVQTADGCSVELYRLIPYRGELEEVRALFRPGTSVLELGCGAGRMTRRMLGLGCHVTAVDSSPEMLAELPREAVRVAADIETLELGSTFGVVVLASHLINYPVAATRAAFVEAARRHTAAGSYFLVERHDPAWLNQAHVGPLGASDGVSMEVEALSREEGLVSMTLRYESNGGTWRQSFSTEALSEVDVEALLTRVGFGSFSWFGPERRWVSALAS